MQKVLLIANPNAGSVSPRVKQVIIKALSADFKLEVADTTRRSHASELARDAVDRDFDAVLALGGDGTINETTQGLVGTEVALGIVPGGSTNVMARALGVPLNPVEATAFVASRVISRTKRRVNAGRVNDRYFLFSAGMGLDAEVVRRVEANPAAKRTHHERLFVRRAFGAGLTQYRGADPMITLQVDGQEPVELISALCCKARPFSYLGRWPVDACPEARLDAGLDVFGLRRLRTLAVPRLVYALFVSRSHTKWKSAYYRHDVAGLSLRAIRSLPLQVDGDFIGDYASARIELVTDALDLLI